MANKCKFDLLDKWYDTIVKLESRIDKNASAFYIENDIEDVKAHIEEISTILANNSQRWKEHDLQPAATANMARVRLNEEEIATRLQEKNATPPPIEEATHEN